jgi:hypothetical protein
MRHVTRSGPTADESLLFTGGLELRDAFQSFCPQCCSIASDRDLAATLDVGNTTVERLDQLSQVTKCACSVGFMRGFFVRHRTCAIVHNWRCRDRDQAAQGVGAPSAPSHRNLG